MNFAGIILLAIGLSMDAFAVSVCKGLAMKKADIRGMVICGAWFGGFQALMPLTGFFLGALFASAIEAADYWIAFALLGFIGANMLKEAFEQDNAESCSDEVNGDLSARIMFVMAVATSIDALAAGISLAMAGGIRILPTVAVIGITTFILSAAGVKVGNIFGSRFEKKAQFAGGIILILLGVKILMEHLGFLS